MKSKLAVLVAIIGVGIGVLISQPAESRDIDKIKRGEKVCVRGVWSSGMYWCGVVMDKDVKDKVIKVRVTDLKLPKGYFGLNPHECTGNEEFGSNENGKEVWIPASCVSD